MRKLLIISLLLFCVIISDNNICHAEKRYIIKFATVAPEGSTWVNAMKKLDKKLRSKSNGRIGFRIYAGGIAGDELDVIKKIRIGQLHCAAFSGVGITEILPMWRVLDLPFLFRDMEEVKLVHKELREMFVKEFRKAGFEYLSWVEVGDIHLFSKKIINTMEDLKGLKIWTYSGDPVSKKTFTSMGISPIPLAVTDVTTALSTNMIDTVYAPVLGALAMQWYSQVNYMTALSITHSTGAILISSEFFNQIPEELRKLVKTEVNISMEELSDDLIRQEKESIEIIQRDGIKIIPMPTGSELDEFRSLHKQVAQDLINVVYPKELLEKVYNILEKHRLNQ